MFSYYSRAFDIYNSLKVYRTDITESCGYNAYGVVWDMLWIHYYNQDYKSVINLITKAQNMSPYSNIPFVNEWHLFAMKGFVYHYQHQYDLCAKEYLDCFMSKNGFSANIDDIKSKAYCLSVATLVYSVNLISSQEEAAHIIFDTYMWFNGLGVVNSISDSKQVDKTTYTLAQLVIADFSMSLKEYERAIEYYRLGLKDWKEIASNKNNPGITRNIKGIKDCTKKLFNENLHNKNEDIIKSSLNETLDVSYIDDQEKACICDVYEKFPAYQQDVEYQKYCSNLQEISCPVGQEWVKDEDIGSEFIEESQINYSIVAIVSMTVTVGLLSWCLYNNVHAA